MPREIQLAQRILGDDLVLVRIDLGAEDAPRRLEQARVAQQPREQEAVAVHRHGEAQFAMLVAQHFLARQAGDAAGFAAQELRFGRAEQLRQEDIAIVVKTLNIGVGQSHVGLKHGERAHDG